MGAESVASDAVVDGDEAGALVLLDGFEGREVLLVGEATGGEATSWRGRELIVRGPGRERRGSHHCSRSAVPQT